MIKIVIDPGHGGYDPGAVGPGGVREKDINLSVATKLADLFMAAGAEVRLTRDSDNIPWTPNSDLSKRVQIANQFGANVFISIHANAVSSPTARGMEVWTTVGQTAADPLAESIANSLQAVFPDLVFRADMTDGDQDKEANFYVLYQTVAPAVLVELAFISNPIEEELLNTSDYQAKASLAIAKGVAECLDLKLPEFSSSDLTAQAIKKLQSAGVINSPGYWLENACSGKQVNGEYAGMLIQKMAKLL